MPLLQLYARVRTGRSSRSRFGTAHGYEVRAGQSRHPVTGDKVRVSALAPHGRFTPSLVAALRGSEVPITLVVLQLRIGSDASRRLQGVGSATHRTASVRVGAVSRGGSERSQESTSPLARGLRTTNPMSTGASVFGSTNGRPRADTCQHRRMKFGRRAYAGMSVVVATGTCATRPATSGPAMPMRSRCGQATRPPPPRRPADRERRTYLEVFTQ